MMNSERMTRTNNRVSYKKVKLGWIPVYWDFLSIGDFTSKVGSGSTPRGGEAVYTESGVPFIRSQNVNENKLLLNDIRFIPDSIHEKMSFSTVQAKDILLNITGASIGRSCVVPYEFTEGNVNQHVCIIRTQAQVDVDFIQFFLASFHGQKSILQSQVGGNREGLNHSNVRNIKVPLPPLPEQRKIAQILSTWDRAIDKLQKLITKKQERKIGLMQQLLTGKKRFDGFDGKWETTKLGFLMDKILGGGTPSKKEKAYWGGDIPWATVKDLSNGNTTSTIDYITELGVQQSSANVVPERTIITATRMALGVVKLFEVPVAINQDLKALFPKKILNKMYLFWWLRNNASSIERLGSGSTVRGIQLTSFRNILFEFPNLEEQQKIASVLSAADSEIEKLEVQLEKLQEQKKGLMQKLLTGEIRVKNFEMKNEK